MSVEYQDSFDIYADANGSIPLFPANQFSLLRRWTIISGSDTNTGVTGARNGSCVAISSGGGLTKTVSHQPKFSVGIAYYFNSPNINHAGASIWRMRNNNVLLFDLVLNNTGTISLLANVTPIATTAFALAINTYYLIEFEVTLSGSANISVHADVWISNSTTGALLGSAGGTALSGINNVNLLSLDSTINSHSLSAGAGDGQGSAYVDDLYIFNGLTIYDNARVAQLWKLGALYSNGDVITQMNPTPVGTHFSKLNEKPEDADTTYVDDSVINHQDIFDFQDTLANQGLLVVQLSTCCKITDEGFRTLQAVVGDTGTEAQSSTIYPSFNYRYYTYGLDTDPINGFRWTVIGFNAKRFGCRLTG